MARAQFAVVYRWRLVEGRERDFELAWARLTERLRAERGGLGSCLHRAEDGSFVAYARWPDRATWQRSRDAGAVDAAAAGRMGEAIAETFEPLLLDLLDDRLGA
jgi:quinol monooxygenase YgiN